MATEALQELLRRLNIEQSDCLDKTEWVKLCSQDTINISSELAGAVFDGLDNDADGQVCISDIMKEIKAFEAAAEVNSISRTPDPRTSSTDSNAPMRTTPSPVPNFKGPRFRLPEVRESRRKGRVFGRGTFSRQSPTIHLNDSGDSFITKKELGEDGSEVFCTTPAPITPRYQTLLELEAEISRCYPELLPTFNNVVEDFRTEIRASRQERSHLEQNYLKEKEARRKDLARMENELELQIQRVEERAKREINDRLRDEYDMKIKKKEEEIADIQAQIRSLRMRMGGSDVDGSDVPDSTTMDRVTTDLNLLVMSPSYRQRALSRLSSHLVPDLPLLEVMAKLESTELELASLKEQLAEQEKRLHFNTLDHLDEAKMCTHFQSPRNSSSLRSGAQSLDSMELNPVTPQPPERMFKVILVGDTGVGKSSFMHQFCDGVFYPRLRATVGVDFRTRNLRVDQKVYSIQLWDTAGQEKYRSIVRTYFRKVDGVIVVYDVTAPSTFRNVRSWMEQIYSISSHPNVPVIIVGNKIDLRLESQSSMVTTEVGQNLAESYNALFIETSIPTAENVDETVRRLANAMKLNEDTQLASVQLTPSPTKPIRSCCKS